MSANPDNFSHNESIREAMEKAFDAHYEGMWIDDVDDSDWSDLVREIWAIRIDNRKKPEMKFFDIANVIDRYAEKKCRAHAEKNWNDHLGG